MVLVSVHVLRLRSEVLSSTFVVLLVCLREALGAIRDYSVYTIARSLWCQCSCPGPCMPFAPGSPGRACRSPGVYFLAVVAFPGPPTLPAAVGPAGPAPGQVVP